MGGGRICSTATGIFSAEVELEEHNDFDGDPEAETLPESETLLLVSFPPLFRDPDFSEPELDSLPFSSGDCPDGRSSISTCDPEAPGSIVDQFMSRQ